MIGNGFDMISSNEGTSRNTYQENVDELEKCRPQNHVRALFSVRLCLLHSVKTIGVGVVICFFLIGVLNASETMGLPTNVCLGDFCGPMQKDIWNRFQGATGLKLRLIPSVYCGPSGVYLKVDHALPHLFTGSGRCSRPAS